MVCTSNSIQDREEKWWDPGTRWAPVSGCQAPVHHQLAELPSQDHILATCHCQAVDWSASVIMTAREMLPSSGLISICWLGVMHNTGNCFYSDISRSRKNSTSSIYLLNCPSEYLKWLDQSRDLRQIRMISCTCTVSC